MLHAHELRARRRGIEFVLKDADGKWRSWKQGHGNACNFYAELPSPVS